MNTAFVIFQNMGFQPSDLETKPVAVRVGLKTDIEKEVDFLNKELVNDSKIIDCFYSYAELPTSGFSLDFSSKFKDAYLQMTVFSNHLKTSLPRIQSAYYRHGVDKMGVTLKEYFFENYSENELPKEKAEALYDQFVEEFGIIDEQYA